MQIWIKKWWQDPDLNWGHKAFQASALPTELSRHAKWTQQKIGFLCQIKNSSIILFLFIVFLYTFIIRHSLFDTCKPLAYWIFIFFFFYLLLFAVYNFLYIFVCEFIKLFQHFTFFYLI